MKKLSLKLLKISLLASLFVACGQKGDIYYSADDFGKVPKIDAHFHYNTTDNSYIKFADSLNFRLVSPNVDAGESIDRQLQVSHILKQQFPDKNTFLGTFSVEGFGRPDFATKVILRIDSCLKAGASGIKIWKNVGMVLKDSLGMYVMADNPKFDSIYNYLEINNIPLMGHLGEPKNCWLPLDQMTLDNDKNYFTNHPEYHMFLHPEAPSYEAQIVARDNILKRHPKLNFIGAHLGSLEWSIDELAKRLDQFPNFNVDFSARIGHLQYQSSKDREKVRQFIIKYQDRLLYGTDGSLNEQIAYPQAKKNNLRNIWLEQFIYLATDELVIVKDLGGLKVQGLRLPCEVIDKIYSKNTVRLLKLKGN